jgi:dolichol-phosphate mannosyltransferase
MQRSRVLAKDGVHRLRRLYSRYDTPHLGRILRFLVGGGSAAALNLVLAYIAVDLLGFRSGLQQNYVNFAAMEISLVYSFFVYRAFVWKDKGTSLNRVLLRQLPLYHLSAGVGLLSRTLLFPILQIVGLNYLLNILVGIMAGAAVNYMLTDRYVFRSLTNERVL